MWYNFSSEVVAFKQFSSRKVSLRWINHGNKKMKTIRKFVVECRRIVVLGHKNDIEKHECNLSHAHMPTTLIGGV